MWGNSPSGLRIQEPRNSLEIFSTRGQPVSLTGPAEWTSVRIAISRGDGSFVIADNTYTPSNEFSWRASHPRAVAVTGDFDRNGMMDIALIGPPDWNTVPILFTYSWGLSESNAYVGSVVTLASNPTTAKVAGDYNMDGKTDIAILGGSSSTFSIASGNGDGTFRISNPSVGGFKSWVSQPGVTILPGIFRGSTPIN
jgi:hypothetical protein